MAVAYWLALLPTLAVLVGGIFASIEFVRQASAKSFMLLAISCLVLWAMVYMSLTAPYYSLVKAFFGLSALVPFCAFGALGLDFLTRRSAVLRGLVCIGLGLWAVNSYACFWISRTSGPSTIEQACALIRQGRFVDATKLLEQRLRSEPGNTDLQFSLAFFLTTTGRVDEGARLAATMVNEHPDDCRGHHVLALAAAYRHETVKVLDETRQVIALAPGYDPSWKDLARLLVDPENPDATISLTRQALAAARFSPELHLSLGSALEFKGQDAEAEAQIRYACLLNPQTVDTLAELAWRLATDSSQSRRNGTVAVRLAEQACAVYTPHQTIHIVILAAAYAEASRYPDAIKTAERAHASALAAGDATGAALTKQLIALFNTGQPYREAAAH
jgi:tetratricopeptide (TPR) repeat protein